MPRVRNAKKRSMSHMSYPKYRIRILAPLLLLAAGCSKSEPPPAKDAEPSAKPAADSGPVTLQGSGASFPAPLYSRWFKDFGAANSSVRVNYQATGSGAGVKAFIAGQTDFGASDAAMTDAEI